MSSTPNTKLSQILEYLKAYVNEALMGSINLFILLWHDTIKINVNDFSQR